MPTPADSAVRSAVRDSGAASDNPKLPAASRPVSNSVGPNVAESGKSNLAASIQTLKELGSKGGPNFAALNPSGLTGEPLSTAYEKRIRTLQDTLNERDQVVQMLTQRLEQAADQLDRMQRNGTGRAGAAATGFPPELIENQQSLVEQLTRVLGEWEETQAGQTLTRIETQITELRELVASGAVIPANLSAIASSANELTGKKAADRTPQGSASMSVFSDIAAAEPERTGWEAIKAAMMAGQDYDPAMASPSATSAKPSVPSSVSVTENTLAESDFANPRSSLPPLPEAPAIVDFEIADHAMLIEAIHSRDEFISTLLRRFSSPDANTEFPDWDKLNFVPEDLHRELLNLRDRMQEKLRVAEVDLSLQRAKLAREEAKLSVKADQVARQMKQLGLSPDDAGSQISGTRSSETASTTQGRRWLQFLQRSNGSGSGTDGK